MAKRILRKIVRFEASDYLTKRNNPQNYRILLECGHYFTRYHSRVTGVRHRIFKNLPEANLQCRCRDCEQNRPIDMIYMQFGDLPYLEPFIPDIRKKWEDAIKDTAADTIRYED